MNPASRTTLIITAALLAACGRTGATRAVAELTPLGDSEVAGTATFTVVGDKVRVDADISGLAPGTHGFHIHEYGDCTAADGKTAGDHFNPDQHAHSGPGSQGHAGDLGNVEADANGEVHVSVTLDQITVDAGERGILGRSLIVHEKADDLISQPAGDAGGRIACAFIREEVGATKPVVPHS